MAETDSTPVRVFISYSLDSTEHEKRVLAFSKRLRDHGVDAINMRARRKAGLHGWHEISPMPTSF
jgi:hypothetical protein